MKLRPFAAAALLTAAALLATACQGKATPDAASSSPAGQQTTADAKAELAAAFDKTAQQTLVKAVMKTEGIVFESEVDRSAKLMHATMSGTSEGSPIGLEIIVSGSDMYTKYTEGVLAEYMKPQMNGKEWIKTDASDLTGEDLFSLGEMFDSSKVLPAASTVTKSGTTYTVANGGGEDATGFLGGLTGNDEKSADPDAPKSMTVTLDAQGLVSAINVQPAKPDEKPVEMTYAFGAPVDVKVPDAGDVLEK